MPSDDISAANYEEDLVGPVVLPDLVRPDGGAVRTPEDRQACRAAWLDQFARHLYGPIPPPPDRVTLERRILAGEGCEHLRITCHVGTRRLRVDAALWRPTQRDRPVPLIAGLSFLGPAGVLPGDSFPLDPAAVVAGGPENGVMDGRLADTVRGMHAHRWPLPLLLGAGFGVLLTCYGSWTPDSAAEWRERGVAQLFDASATGAISLWAWAAQRLIDVAAMLPEIDAARVTLAGHSRLGKAALWAAANDSRAAAVIANNAGCAGPAPSRRNFGETLRHMQQRFPHWTVLDAEAAADPEALAVDQHQLLACIAPRRLYVASASDDLWADPRGEYIGLRAALPFWRLEELTLAIPEPGTALHPGYAVRAGPVAWHLRRGGHALTPWDWRRFLMFLTG